ncbi:MAG: hypothetical protein LBB22_01905 [Treponema sp.]|jgi:hypothetical protein|nr:hypothetical protein [Treponema sp.]
MNKPYFIFAFLFAPALIFFGCNLKESSVDTSSIENPVDIESKTAELFAEILNNMLNGGTGTEVYAKVDGSVITIVKSFNLYKQFPISLVKGLTLNIGGTVAANDTPSLSKETGAADSTIKVTLAGGLAFNAGDGDIMLYQNGGLAIGEKGAFNISGGSVTLNGLLTVAKDGNFNVSNGYVTLDKKGNLSIGTNGVFNVEEGAVNLAGNLSVGYDGVFDVGNGRTDLYGILDIGSGQLKSNASGRGLLVIHPAATLKDLDPSSGIERELIGANSIVLSNSATLELKGEFVSAGSCSRILTLNGGSATVKGDMAIFNDGGKSTESIILKNGANIIIDGNDSILAILSTVDTNPDVGSISNYIKVDAANTGTIACINGGSLAIGSTMVLTTGSSAAWSGAAWELITTTEE